MWTLALILFVGAAPVQPAAPGAESTCVRCHRDLNAELVEPVRLSSRDVHFQKGLTCSDCHGGDPSVGIEKGSAEDSMSRAKGFIGHPQRKQIAALCASCHSKPEVMRRYNPQARVDQYAEYLTSVHGKKYLQGDANVATCTDCHGAHGVRGVNDPTSPVYAANVAATCGKCHADSKRMASYGIPTNQMDLYTKSVHGDALIRKRDMSAPTCNDCHGNHGATPPGVDSVANVCGQCHVSQWDLFGASPHKKAFAEQGLLACSTCHEHHDVKPTSDAMLGGQEPAICATCHDAGTPGNKAAVTMKEGITHLHERIGAAEQVLQRAERAGMEVSRPLYDLTEARNYLIKARVDVHRFDPAALDKDLDGGGKIAAASAASGWKALGELAYRRKGLGVSVVIIIAMIVLLVLKIRETDRRTSS
jgi:predicted CXXCH cytochrome family protein